MNTENNILQKLEESVSSKDIESVSRAASLIDMQSCSPTEIINALSRGIEKAREYFKNGIFSIPDLLVAIDAYRRGVNYLKEISPNPISRKEEDEKPRVVIGVVEGDVHDMGKNIVAAVLEACGYQVYDLGRNVANASFLEAIRTTNADILALSAMMSTPLANMRMLIEMAKTMYPRTAIIVGGAPFDADLARRMGADGYAENAITAPDETNKLLISFSSDKKLIK
ncbi:corrinoid methyltransferase protein [hydrocarbon metagenome]|uniref:Corrinoid methyltransferase protein n=1 Tax=hydrocarbon metagenome TaxID=938273 RepID=A0A0W8FPX1_9ZZZZ